MFSSICTRVTRSIELHELHQLERFHALAFTIVVSITRRFLRIQLIRRLQPEIYILSTQTALAKTAFPLTMADMTLSLLSRYVLLWRDLSRAVSVIAQSVCLWIC